MFIRRFEIRLVGNSLTIFPQNCFSVRRLLVGTFLFIFGWLFNFGVSVDKLEKKYEVEFTIRSIKSMSTSSSQTINVKAHKYHLNVIKMLRCTRNDPVTIKNAAWGIWVTFIIIQKSIKYLFSNLFLKKWCVENHLISL